MRAETDQPMPQNHGVSSPSRLDDKAAAKEAFDRGKRFFNTAQYVNAAAAFRRSYELSGNPDLLFNIGQAYRLAGQNEQAIAAYRSFLREVPESPNRALAEAKLEDLQIAQLKPPIRSSPSDATAKPIVEEALIAPPVKRSAPEGASIPAWLPWTGAAITGALVVGAIAAGLSANSKFYELKRTCGVSGNGCQDSDIDALNGRARTANILWVLSGISAVGTGVVVFLDLREGQQALSMSGRF